MLRESLWFVIIWLLTSGGSVNFIAVCQVTIKWYFGNHMANFKNRCFYLKQSRHEHIFISNISTFFPYKHLGLKENLSSPCPENLFQLFSFSIISPTRTRYGRGQKDSIIPRKWNPSSSDFFLSLQNIVLVTDLMLIESSQPFYMSFIGPFNNLDI